MERSEKHCSGFAQAVACLQPGIAYNTMMDVPCIVLDTNILVAAIRSRRGASFRLLEQVGQGRFEVVLSVALVFEYEEVLDRHRVAAGLEKSDIRDLLDYLCVVGRHQEIFYLWRPFLPDPDDDHILELAVAAGCDGIVTFNVRDFAGADRFGLWIETPRVFLRRIGALPCAR
jgi:predicted nucleic acid-binding protein